MYTIEQGKELNELLGYNEEMESFAVLYPNGGSINAFGYPDASMHTLKHEFAFDDSQNIRFVATHTTYFEVKPDTFRLNQWLEVNGPKSIDECIAYLKG